MARSAGLRIGEILNLTWEDFDFNEAIVHIQPKKETDNTWAWHPKDYEIRELPLSAQAVQLLLQLRKECPSSQPYALLKTKTYIKILRWRD